MLSENPEHNIQTNHPSTVQGGVFERAKKTRTIVMKEIIPRDSRIYLNGVSITSGRYIRQDFNAFDFGRLQNTKDIKFSLYDHVGDEFIDLPIPQDISERLGEYFRNRKDIESDERYRLPGGLKNFPVNCMSFVYYVKGWFQDQPRELRFQYIATPDDTSSIHPGDVIYTETGDEASGIYWHYLISIGQGFCIGKNGHSRLVVTRRQFQGMYKIIPEYEMINS